MNERIIHLRIKIKNLADEAKSIRQEAAKASGMVKWGLNQHRTSVVRRAARENLLAYGLLRHIPYESIEKNTSGPLVFMEHALFPAVVKIARRFGGEDLYIEAWVASAKDYLKEQEKQREESAKNNAQAA